MFYFYLAIVVLLVLLAIFLIVYPFAKAHITKAKHKNLVGRKLYRLAQDNDYYLLHNLVIHIDEEVTLHIDHLLFADKFIYVIADRYYQPGLSGRPEDNTWFAYPKKKSKKAVKNLVLINEERTIRLAKFLGWNETKSPMLISVVCLNDSVILSPELASFNNQYSFLVKKKNLVKRIIASESNGEVPPLDAENLAKLTAAIHELSTQASTSED